MGQSIGNNHSASIEESVAAQTRKQTTTFFPDVTYPTSQSNVHILQNVLLVWLDQTIDEENNRDCQKNLAQLCSIVNRIKTFTDADQCVDFLGKLKDEKVCIIMSGSLGQTTVPRVHEMFQVNSIIIFCGNIAWHEQWIKNWPKIKGVCSHITSICETLKEAAKQCERDATPMSILSTRTSSDTPAHRNWNHLEPSFMYTQILKEILLSIAFEERHFQEFIDFCYESHAQKQPSDNLETFKQEYHDKTPVWWYTSDTFLYPMLNCALRLMNMDVLIRMGFFISALHRQLEQLHNEQFSDHQSGNILTVFRGQGLSNASFKEIQNKNVRLLSFNNFLSTSRNRNVSLGFAHRALSTEHVVAVLFVITVDPANARTPFAYIHDVGYHGNKEEEILFSMHTIFRVGTVEPIDEKSRLYQVELTLTKNDDQDLCVLTDHIRKQTEGSTGWDRLGQLLLKAGQPKEAEEVYEILLKQTTDEGQKGDICHRLGSAKYHQEQYQEAVDCYHRARIIRERVLPPNHPDLAMTYNNLGNTYSAIGITYDNIGNKHIAMDMYTNAIYSHKKALEIRQQSYPLNEIDLAMSYDSIGSVGYYMGEYSQALPFHEKALHIRQQVLPSNHPDLAISYNNLGMVNRATGRYSKARPFHELAVDVGQRSLPSDHPHLQFYKNKLDAIRNLS